MKKIISLVAAAALAAFAFCGPARASQGSGCMPTSGTVSGLTLVQDINAANAAFISMNSGATAPATDCSGLAVYGQSWLDTTQNQVKLYDGASWLLLGSVDPTNHIWMPIIGGGTDSIISNTTTDLCSSKASVITITSNTTITGFGSSCSPGNMKVVKFATALTLTNGPSLVLPGGLNITTAAGDYLTAVYVGGGAWAVNTYTRADGSAVKNPAVDVCTAAYFVGADAPTKWALGFGQALNRADYPDYVTCATRTQTGTRSSGGTTISGLSDVSGMAVGMPVEGPGIQSGTTIASIASTSSITISVGASSSGSGNVQVFFTGYGTGGSSTTIGVPDCRGRTLVGRDDMGGTAANRLSSTYFGLSAAGMNVGGGSQNTTMALVNLIQHDHTVFLHDPGHTHTFPSTSVAIAGGSFAHIFAEGAQNGNTAPSATGITLWSDGDNVGTQNHVGKTGSASPTPMRTIQPSLTSNCMVRVLP